AAILGLSTHLDALRAQVGDRRIDVVAQEVERVIRLAVRRMNADLGRRQREDQPAVARVDMLPAEHVAQRRSERIRLRCEEQHVRSSDQGPYSLLDALAAQERREVDPGSTAGALA